jgi:uncharacterized membrane protein
VAALCASNVAALIFVIWVWVTVGGIDPAATTRLAPAEDASRTAAEAVVVAAGAASLVAVFFTLGQAGRAASPERGRGASTSPARSPATSTSRTWRSRSA